MDEASANAWRHVVRGEMAAAPPPGVTQPHQSVNGILFELGGFEFDGTRLCVGKDERDGIDETVRVG